MKRNQNIDLIKIVAMMLVIATHAVQINRMTDIDGNDRLRFIIDDIIYYGGIVSIPMFLMASGYLLLGREQTGIRYSVGKILSIVKFSAIIMLCLSVIYRILHELGLSDSLNASLAPADLLEKYLSSLLPCTEFFVFWYFGAMMIIYLLLPALNRLYRNKQLFIPFMTFLLLFQTFMFTQNLTDAAFSEHKIYLVYRIWNWLSYFCIGGAVKWIKGYTPRWWAIAILFMITYLYQFHYRQAAGYRFEYFYGALPAIVLTTALFMFLLSLPLRESRLITELSKTFLPVYVFHYTIASNITPLWSHCGAISPIVQLCATSIIVIPLSWGIMKIPYANRIFRL